MQANEWMRTPDSYSVLHYSEARKDRMRWQQYIKPREWCLPRKLKKLPKFSIYNSSISFKRRPSLIFHAVAQNAMIKILALCLENCLLSIKQKRLKYMQYINWQILRQLSFNSWKYSFYISTVESNLPTETHTVLESGRGTLCRVTIMYTEMGVNSALFVCDPLHPYHRPFNACLTLKLHGLKESQSKRSILWWWPWAQKTAP